MFGGLAHRYRPYIFALLLLVAATSAFAQGARRPKDDDNGETDRPAERERYFRRGRTVPGKSAAGLRYHAYKDKMSRRAAARALSSAPASATSSATPANSPSPATPAQPSGPAWVALGPAPIGVDTSSGQNFGVNSGRMTSIVVDQSDPSGNTVYAGAAYGGLWKSTNAANPDPNAVQWTPLIDDQPTLAVGAIALKPGDSNTILVGTGEANNSGDSYYGLGILRSTDGGATWSLISGTSDNTKSFKGLAFSKIAFSTDNPNLVVAATANSNATTLGIDTSNIRGIYYSTDAGATWQYASMQDNGITITPASTSSIVYHPALHKFFAAVRYHGYYSSIDGVNWTRLAVQPTTILSTALCPANVSFNCPIFRGEIAIQPVTGAIFTWFIDANDGERGIYRSTNGGTSWNVVGTTGIDSCGDVQGCGVHDQGDYDLELAAVPNGTGTDLYAGAINIYKCSLSSTATTCTSWLNLTHVYGCTVWGQPAHVHPDQHAVDFSRTNPNLIYFGHDGGVSRALNGPGLLGGLCTSNNAFDNLSGTLGSVTEFVSFSEHPTDDSTVLGGAQDVGSSAVDATHPGTGGLAWMSVNSGDGGFNAINPVNPLEWFTANTDVSIQRCTNGINCNAQGFINVVSNGQVGGDHGDFYTPYILDPGMPSKIIVGTCRVWRGNSDGTGWTSANVLTTNFDTGTSTACTGAESNLVSALAAGGPVGNTGNTGSNVVYAGTNAGTIFATTNAPGGANSWISSPTPGNHKISDIAIDPSDPTGYTAYATGMGFSAPHVFKTTNGGQGWGFIDGDLPDAPVDSIAIDPNDPTVIYLGTDVGVFVTTNGGTNWTEWGTGLPNAPVTRIRTFVSQDGSKNKLRVSTYGRGVWETDLLTAKGDFSVQITGSATLNGFAGQTATLNGVLIAKYGYSSPVTLSCSGNLLPATCTGGTFTPTPQGTPFTVTVGDPSISQFTFTLEATGADAGATSHEQQITFNSFELTLGPPSPSSVTIPRGKSDASTIVPVSVSNNFSGEVDFSCDPASLPAGLSCSFSPSSYLIFSAQKQFNFPVIIVAAKTTTPGTYPISLVAQVVGGSSKTLTLTATVTLNPLFQLSVSPASISLKPGQSGSVGYTVTSVDGYAGTVNVGCTTYQATCGGVPSSVSSFPGTGNVNVTLDPNNNLGGSLNLLVSAKDSTLSTYANVYVNVLNYGYEIPQSVLALPGSTINTSFHLYPAMFDGQVAVTCDATAIDPAATCTVTGSPFTLVHQGAAAAVPITVTIPAGATQASGRVAIHTYDANYPSLTHDTSFQVDVPFLLTSITPLQQVLAGQTTSPYFLTLTGGPGLSAPATLACSGLPAGASCAFSPASLTISDTPSQVSVSVSTTTAVPVGDYNFSITATAAGATKSVPATLRVGDFGVTVSANPLVLVPGVANQYEFVQVTSVNNYTGVVTLSCGAGLPQGVTCQGGGNVQAGGGLFFLISAASTTAPQTVSLSLAATSTGSGAVVARSASLTLAVEDFALTLTPATQTVSPASPITFTANVAGINGFDFPVYLTCIAGLPSSVPTIPCTASPDVIAPGQPATITITPSGDQYPPTATVTLTAALTQPMLNRTVTATANLVDFYLFQPSTVPTAPAGTTAIFNFTAKAFNGFNSPINLTCDGGAPGVTCTVNNPVVTPTATGVAVPVTVTTPSTPISGSYQISITGTGAGITHHNSQNLFVNGFHISATPDSANTPIGGGSAIFSATAVSDNAAATVAWSCVSPPAGVSCSFAPSSVSIPINGSSSSTLNVTVSSSVPAGGIPLTIRGTSGNLTQNAALQLVVGPDFQLTSLTQTATVVQGQSQTYGVRIGTANGFAQPVTLSCSGLPDGATCAFDNNPVTPASSGQNVNVTVSTAASVPSGTYPFAIVGASAGILHSAAPATQLVVQNVPDFSLIASPPIITIAPGFTASATIYASLLGGLPSTTQADFSCAAISDPTVTCNVQGSSVLGASPAAFISLHTTAATPPSDISVTIHAQQHGGGPSHDVTFTLRVSDYSLSQPADQTAQQGGRALYNFTITALNHWTSAFSPMCQNLPPGLGPCIFTPSNVAPGPDPVPVALSLAVAPNAPLGQSTFQIAGGFPGHTVNASLTVIPTQDFDFTSLSSSVQPALAGQTLTWSLQLTPLNAYSGSANLSVSGCPSGAVCSLSATTVPLANQTVEPVTLSVQLPSSASPGNLNLTVTASDPVNNKSHAVALSIAVGTFTIAANPASLSIAPGNFGQFSVTMTGQNFIAPVTLACSGLAPGMACTASPSQLSSGQSSTITVATTAGVTPSTGTFNVTASAIALTRTAPVTFKLVDFSVTSISPTSATVNSGTNVPVSLKLTALNGYNSSVAVTCEPQTAIVCTFTPSSITPSATGTTVSGFIRANGPGGVYTVRLDAIGIVTHSIDYSITIRNYHVAAQPTRAIVPVGGGKATYALTFFSDQGFNNILALSCYSPPLGVTCAFSPSSVTPTAAGTNVTLTVSVTSTVPAATYQLNLRSSYSVQVTTTPLTLITGADFSLANVSGAHAVQQTQSTDFHVTATAIGGMNQPVTLSCSGLPAGATCQFSQNPVTPTSAGQDVDVTVQTTLSSVPNTYSVIVQGVGGGVTHTTTLPLTVQYLPDFVLSSASSIAATRPGQSAVFSATASKNGSFTSIVDLTCAGTLPAGAACQVQPPSVDFSSTATVPITITVTTPANAPMADTPFALHGVERGGSKVHDLSLTLRVNDFHLSAPTPQTFAQTDAASYTVTVFADNQFSSPVTLSCNNLPANVGPCAFSTNGFVPAAGGTAVTVTAPVAGQASPGPTSFDVVASGGNTSHTVTEPLNIILVQDFTIGTMSPLTQTATTGQSIGWGILLTPLNSFAANVNLAVTGCPSGFTCSFQPGSPVDLTGHIQQPVNFIVQVPTSASTVNSNITVTATDPVSGKTHALTFTVQVQGITLTASPLSAVVAPGAGTIFNVTVNALNGFNQQVLLACNNPPAGITCTPTMATPGQPVPMTVMTASNSTTGIKTIPIGAALGLGAPPNAAMKNVTVAVSTFVASFTATTPSSAVMAPVGSSASVPISITATKSTFTSPVTLSCLPTANFTCAFSPATVVPSTIAKIVTMTVTPSPQLNPGAYPLTIQALGGTQIRQLNLTVSVADFWITASPASQLIPNPNGGSTSYTVSVQTSSTFNVPVTLSCPGAPSGVTCAFAPASVTPTLAGATSTATVTTTAGSAKGPLNLTFQAASGSLSHQASVQLINGQDFSISASPATLPVNGSYSTALNIAAIGPFSSNVVLACVGSSPQGGPMCTFPGPNGGQGLPGTSVPLTFDPTGVPGGAYTITLQGQSGGLTHTTQLTVNVPDYSLGLTQDLTNPNVIVGGAAVYHGALTAIGGYSGNVNLSCSVAAPLSCFAFPTAPIAATAAGTPFMFSVNVPAGTAPGTYSVQVNADDGAGHLHHANANFVVEDYSVSFGSGSATIEAGTSTTFNGTVTGINGYTGGVQLYCPPDPNITCAFTPATVTASASGTPFSATISTAPATPPNTYTVNLTSNGARVIRTSPFSLTVTPTNDFNVAIANTQPFPINAGDGLNIGMQVTAVNAFSATVTMTCTGAPAGMTCTAPASFPVPPGGNFSLQVQTALGVLPGAYNLSLTSSGGGKTHTQTVTVSVRDFAISATPPAQTVLPGVEADYAVSMTSSSGFVDHALLSCAIVGAPAGASCGFDQPDLTAGGSTTLRVTSSAQTPSGLYTVNLTAASGLTVHTAPLTVQIGGPDFSLTPSSLSATVTRGSRVSAVVTITALHGFTSPVALSCTPVVPAVPCMIATSITPTPTGVQAGALIRPATTAVPGTYQFTITGTGGGQTHTVPLTVTVQ